MSAGAAAGAPDETPMRVLVVHNFYRSANASGENLSVRDEVGALRQRGWQVALVSAASDAIASGHISQPALLLRPTYSYSSSRRVRQAISDARPDVALVENLFPLHSPWVIRVLHREGIPIVAGVRSYRISCVAATHFRDGHRCHECLSSPLNVPALRHRCYRGSRLATLPVVFSQAVHAGTSDLVDRYLAVSDHVRDHLVGIGIEPERVRVRPNYTDDHGLHDEPGHDVLFAGRLTDDKGVALMLDAWIRSEAWRTRRLLVAGSGPYEQQLRRVDPRYQVVLLGLLGHDAVLDAMRAAGVVAMPSLWDEPFGRVVVEAASLGRAALVTDRGALPGLVEHGVTGWVHGTDPASMAAAIVEAGDRAEVVRRGREARARYEERWTEERSIDVLDAELRAAAEAAPRRPDRS